jgi:DNA gyrase subunit A
MKRYKLTELQANAILEMQLRRLAALERKKIETEYKETLALIKDLEGLLKSPKKMRGVASEELLRVKAAYGDRRRTQIVSLRSRKHKAPLTAAELVQEQVVWIGMTADGTIARTHDDKPPRLSGSEAPKLLVKANATDTFYLVSEKGLAAAVAVHTLPEGEKLSDGNPFNKVSPLQADEVPVAAFALPAKKSELPEETCVLTVTRGGIVKKSAISELPGPSAQTFRLVNVNDGDSLGWVVLTDGRKEVLLATAQGMAIRFSGGRQRHQTGCRGRGGWLPGVAHGRRDLHPGVGRESQAGGSQGLPGAGTLRQGRHRLGVAAARLAGRAGERQS